jgi:hypothetical protein
VTPTQRKWAQVLHVAKRECGLDDKAYRALEVLRACGVESARDIKTWEQYHHALKAFRVLGFRIKSKASRAGGLKETDAQTKRNPEWVTARQEYYIRGLWGLASRKKDADRLNALIRNSGGKCEIAPCGTL